MDIQMKQSMPVNEMTPVIERLKKLVEVDGLSMRKIHALEPFSELSFGTLCNAAKGVLPKNAHDRNILGVPALVEVEPCPKCGEVHKYKSCLKEANTRRSETLSVKKQIKQAERDVLVNAFETLLRVLGIEPDQREFVFHPGRKWPFDFAWPEKMIAVELQGGIWNDERNTDPRKRKGGHTTGVGYDRDCEKLAYAQLDGWRVYYITTSMIQNGKAAEILSAVFGRAYVNQEYVGGEL